MYNKSVTKVKVIDTCGFVSKTQDSPDKSSLEKKTKDTLEYTMYINEYK